MTVGDDATSESKTGSSWYTPRHGDGEEEEDWIMLMMVLILSLCCDTKCMPKR